MPLGLTGMMGSGKSTVGQALAIRRRQSFLDPDAALPVEKPWNAY